MSPKNVHGEVAKLYFLAIPDSKINNFYQRFVNN